MRQHHPDALAPGPQASALRQKTYEVIFGHETPAGRAFDVALIAAILASVVAIMLESVPSIRADYGRLLRVVEWGFTLAFTVEYALRLWCVRRSRMYALSFFGVVDLLAVLPTWLSLVLPGGQALAVVRILRVLRVFRILKLAQYVVEARVLGQALRASRFKITVFVFAVVSIVVIVGSLMYLVEGPAAGFTSIPAGVYWAVVTLTTVGFGDITPITPFGQFLATVVMLLGYAIIAVPTGIISVELNEVVRGAGDAASAGGSAAAGRPGAARRPASDRICNSCRRGGHDDDADWCKWCGGELD
jgi:voltage-gated potassium channel